MGTRLVLSRRAIDELASLAGSKVLVDEPMSLHTSFRLGGPVDLMVSPSDRGRFADVVRWAHTNGIRPVILGAGSNLLVADRGIRGLVLSTSALKAWEIEGNMLRADSGVLLPALSRSLTEAGFSGFVEACGIPGSVGGGLSMNAGAYGWNISQVTDRVYVVSPSGEEFELDKPGMEFGLKSSVLQNRGYIALSMQAALVPADKDAMRSRAADLLRDRAEKQPLDSPSAGCVFKNPAGTGAGRLIDSCGLKGATVGGAKVSSKHANFIINSGGAKAADVFALMGMVEKAVFERLGQRLEPEIMLVGDWDGQ